jgi:hypothetical protein
MSLASNSHLPGLLRGLAHVSFGLCRRTNGVGEGLQVILGGRKGRRVWLQTYDVPASWRGEPVRMLLTQVVGVRLGERR